MQFSWSLAVLAFVATSLAAPPKPKTGDEATTRSRKPCKKVSWSSKTEHSSSAGTTSLTFSSVSSLPTITGSSSSATISSTSSSTSSILSTMSSSTSAAPASTSTTASSTSSITSSTSTGYPLPTPGVEQPTNTYTGSIATFTTGTPVSIANPSFEDTAVPIVKGKGRRQTAAQVAAAAAGWTIDSCGSGTLSDCQFENYDAADGIWAFAGPEGGVLYQDDVNLAAGATYAFTFYWKVVSTYTGATSSSTGNTVIQGVYLGNSEDTDVLSQTNYTPEIALAIVDSGGDWAQQTFTVTLSCQYAPFATELLPDGTFNYRMFIRGYSGSGSQAPIGNYTWYVDKIQVQQLTPPSGGTIEYLSTACSRTPPASTTASTTATSTYTITQTASPTATPTSGVNVLSNPSFDTITITDYSTDIVGGATKATVWTYTGCAGKECELHDGLNQAPACQSGRYCENWVSPTTYSQTINITVGTIYFLSFWVLTQATPATTGGSVTIMTVEPVGSTPGSGGVVLSATVTATQADWTQYSEMLSVDHSFLEQVCGAASGTFSASCQVTVSTSYTGAWTLQDNVANYFDNVSFETAGSFWVSADRRI